MHKTANKTLKRNHQSQIIRCPPLIPGIYLISAYPLLDVCVVDPPGKNFRKRSLENQTPFQATVACLEMKGQEAGGIRDGYALTGWEILHAADRHVKPWTADGLPSDGVC